MAMRSQIAFMLNGEAVQIADCDPSHTLLDYLRESRRLTGTKEGCREGDCGACTVVVVTGAETGPRIRAVNACILFLPVIDGAAVFTVEGVATADGLHPIQQELVEQHGSQCGFCTPGFVMSLFAADLNNETPGPERLNEILSGNLCRCTGYRPIAEAASAALSRKRMRDPRIGEALEGLKQLDCSNPLDIHFHCPRRGQLRYSAPRTLSALVDLLAASPNATILAGGTDIGLWVTKQQRALHHVIDITQIVELQNIETGSDRIGIGAGVTYNDARGVCSDQFPELLPLIARIASEPIRNSGTIGGNIANGSPIGDMPPALIALGAEIILLSIRGERRLSLEDFFLAYGKQDRRSDEVLTRIDIPKLPADAHFRTFKISKRFDQDISALCGAFYARAVEGKLENVRICFGGMAGTPKRATQAERALEGRAFDAEALEHAVAALRVDFEPLSDHRASADYRMLAAQGLMRKFHADVQGETAVTLDREFAR